MSVVDIPSCPVRGQTVARHPIMSGRVYLTRAHESSHRAVRWEWMGETGERHTSRSLATIQDGASESEWLAAMKEVAWYVAAFASGTY